MIEAVVREVLDEHRVNFPWWKAHVASLITARLAPQQEDG